MRWNMMRIRRFWILYMWFTKKGWCWFWLYATSMRRRCFNWNTRNVWYITMYLSLSLRSRWVVFVVSSFRRDRLVADVIIRLSKVCKIIFIYKFFNINTMLRWKVRQSTTYTNPSNMRWFKSFKRVWTNVGTLSVLPNITTVALYIFTVPSYVLATYSARVFRSWVDLNITNCSINK